MTIAQIRQTEAWVRTVIVHYNICPFAQAVVEQNRIFYAVDESDQIEANLTLLIKEAERLDNDASIETTLLIYANNFADFDNFLDYLELANQLLIMQGYEGVYQLASFHPNYCFEGSAETDAANYTNRSPYPMLHLIREASIERVLQSFPDPENIPQRNIALTRKLGLAKMQALLAACNNSV